MKELAFGRRARRWPRRLKVAEKDARTADSRPAQGADRELHLGDIEDPLRASLATPKKEGGDGDRDDSQGGTSGDGFVDDPAGTLAASRTTQQREPALKVRPVLDECTRTFGVEPAQSVGDGRDLDRC